MQPTCPYCRAPFDPDDELVVCPGCGATHHADCLAENGGCTVFGCSQAPAEEEKISVTANETRQGLATPYPHPEPAIQAPYSFLNLQTAAPILPPPSLPSGVPPPPNPNPQPEMNYFIPRGFMQYGPYTREALQHYVETGNILATDFARLEGSDSTILVSQILSNNAQPPQPQSYPTFAGYAPAALVNLTAYLNLYQPRKSRVVFVLLAVFLGPFGGHNFYAGYTTKAIIQLCITVLTCFFAGFVSWIWAIVEACVIDHDNDGIAFV